MDFSEQLIANGVMFRGREESSSGESKNSLDISMHTSPIQDVESNGRKSGGSIINNHQQQPPEEEQNPLHNNNNNNENEPDY